MLLLITNDGIVRATKEDAENNEAEFDGQITE